MKISNRHLNIALLAIIIFVSLELISRFLLSPNLIEVEGNPKFLLRTNWNQTGEYAKFVEYDEDAGCWAVAIAQIAQFHGLDPKGKIEYKTSKGNHIAEDFDSFKFRHSIFANEITERTSADSKLQAAKYIYFIAALIYTDFGSSGYLEHDTFVPRLEKHLHCFIGFHQYSKERYLKSKNQIIALIKSEIDARRPLMLYFDNGDDFGHAAALDGYTVQNNQFLVHLNMGWGGIENGWYDPFNKIFGLRDDLQNRFLITFYPD